MLSHPAMMTNSSIKNGQLNLHVDPIYQAQQSDLLSSLCIIKLSCWQQKLTMQSDLLSFISRRELENSCCLGLPDSTRLALAS